MDIEWVKWFLSFGERVTMQSRINDDFVGGRIKKNCCTDQIASISKRILKWNDNIKKYPKMAPNLPNHDFFDHLFDNLIHTLFH